MYLFYFYYIQSILFVLFWGFSRLGGCFFGGEGWRLWRFGKVENRAAPAAMEVEDLASTKFALELFRRGGVGMG